MNKRKPEWTDQLDLALIIMREQGMTFAQIASELDCHSTAASARAIELGVHKAPFRWTPDADAWLTDLLAAGWTYSGCAQQIGVARLQVEERAVKLFGPRPTPSNSRHARTQARASRCEARA